MFQPVSLFIGSRYSKSQNNKGFVSFITFFSVAGIFLGVTALITVVSVMNGFEGQLKEKLLGLVPHVLVESNNEQTKNHQWLPHEQLIPEINKLPGVNSATPYSELEALIQSNNQMVGVLVQGIYPQYDEGQSIVSTSMQAGSLNSIKPGKYNMVLGALLARKLNVSIGDKVRVILPTKTRFTPMGRIPMQRTFSVSGIFHVGSQIDDQMVIIHGQDAARLERKKGTGVEKIRLYLDDAFTSEQIVQQLKNDAQYSGLEFTTWRMVQGKLFEAVKMEKNMMWIMLSLIVAVAAFNIVSALVMVVIEKQGEIGILKTLGMDRTNIVKVFVTQGFINGMWGASLGCIGGVLLTTYINQLLSLMGLNLLGAGFPEQSLPTILNWNQVLIIYVSAIIMSFLATLYPAYRASNTQPAEVLRNE